MPSRDYPSADDPEEVAKTARELRERIDDPVMQSIYNAVEEHAKKEAET